MRSVIKNLCNRQSKVLGGQVRNVSEKLDPIQRELMKERCILLDTEDRVIGDASKATCHLVDPMTGLTPLHRAFSLFIFDQNNRLLLQQRSSKKITFPLLWTNSCCSHPLAISTEMDLFNESIGVKRAAQRKSLQELGIKPEDLPIDNMTYLTRIIYNSSGCGKWGEHELDYILFIKDKDGRISLDVNSNEIENVAYVSQKDMPEFLKEEMAKGNGVTPWFTLISSTFLNRWWSNLDNLETFKDHDNITRFTSK